MSDIGVAEIPVDEKERPLPPPRAPVRNALVDGPILRTLLWLAWPNVIALSAGTCVVIAETSYIGRLGVESLAAMALVFPFVILTMTMSGGAMGGGVASAIARALGAGDVDRASTLAAHALADRHLPRADVHAGHADLRTRAAGAARRPRQCAGLRHRLCADLFRRRGGAVADEHVRGNPARHRQHEAAVAADAVFRHLPDHSRRHARPWPRADPVIRHARRRRGLAGRLRHQRIGHGLVHLFRARARGSQDPGPSYPDGRCSSIS